MNLIELSAHFSLVQICPDPERGEAINVGLILLCPSTMQLIVRFVNFRRRATCIFPAIGSDLAHIEGEIESLSEWARLQSGVLSLSGLRDFIQRPCGLLQFTPLRWTRVEDAEMEADLLCQRLVGGLPSRSIEQRIRLVYNFLRDLDGRFRPLQEAGRVQIRSRVEIPGYDVLMPVHYRYLNGRETFVLAEPFGGRQASMLDRAAKLAMRGDQLVRSTNGRRNLSVIPIFERSDTASKHEGQLLELFSRHSVSMVRGAEINDFVEYVTANARALPESQQNLTG